MKSSSRFKGSTNFLQPAVHEIEILGNFGAFGSYFGSKNWLPAPFSIISKSILKMDPLKFQKNAVFELSKIGQSPLSSTGQLNGS